MEDLLIIYVLLCFSNFFADRENASGNSWGIPILRQPCTIFSIRLPKTRHTNYSQKHCKCQQNRINTAFLDLKTTVFNCLQIPPKQKIRKPSMTCMKCKSDERSLSLILSHSGLIKFGLSPSQNQGFADIKKSARRGSNPRPPPWQGGAPPLSHSRMSCPFCSRTSINITKLSIFVN